MRIAVASKSGTDVDQHFGHAERFLIYEVTAEAIDLVDEITVEKYCSYDPDHPFRKPQFQAIADGLAGCSAVVTAMIGELPKQELKKQGIEPISVEGPIGELLRNAFKQIGGKK